MADSAPVAVLPDDATVRQRVGLHLGEVDCHGLEPTDVRVRASVSPDHLVQFRVGKRESSRDACRVIGGPTQESSPWTDSRLRRLPKIE